jgi:hypothetical protein
MAQRSAGIRELIVHDGEPVYMIPDIDDAGNHITRIIVGGLPEKTEAQWREEALSQVGAWSDLDWDQLEDGLEEIRHSSRPTPPIDDL